MLPTLTQSTQTTPSSSLRRAKAVATRKERTGEFLFIEENIHLSPCANELYVLKELEANFGTETKTKLLEEVIVTRAKRIHNLYHKPDNVAARKADEICIYYVTSLQRL